MGGLLRGLASYNLRRAAWRPGCPGAMPPQDSLV